MFTAEATPLSQETRDQLIARRESIRTWAPICNGAMALSKACYQFDIIEYAGYLCALGDKARCEDIRKSQDADGRWWRAPNLVGQTTKNSFSRDMFMGLMFYFAATKDTAGLSRWMNYLNSHHNKMCPDGSDNRCSILLSNWGMLGHLYKYLGLKPTFKMKLGMAELGIENIISAATAPKGFELALLADNVFFFRFIGQNKGWMRDTSKIMLKRQKVNPFYRYLVQGATEELGRDLLSACPAQESERNEDFSWSRQMDRNADGDLVIIRKEFAPNDHIPVKVMSDGHDCITAIDFVVDSPF